MKIAILGFDIEGRSSYEYFAAQGGHEITILDQNDAIETPEGVDFVLGWHYLDNLDRFDLIVRTAGLPPSKILDKNPGIEDKITTHINEFLKASPAAKVIGVTGTKGKGTTSTLIAKMLEAGGKTVHLGGNIGVPPLGFINKISADSWVVLELSSFQLIDLKKSPHIAVCLMVVPEHLDWHTDLDEYTAAKRNLFAHQSSDDLAIYYADNEISRELASASPGHKIPFMASPGARVEGENIIIEDKLICKTSELKLLGAHNWQNACAATTAVWQVTQDAEAIRSVLTSFAGLPHRLELVRELGGVRYYDDSFGTTPGTAMVAAQAFAEPKILILGGHGKGVPFDELAKFVTENGSVKKVIVIGESGSEIAACLRNYNYPEQNIIAGGNTMAEIVNQTRQLAVSGDVVLLSTACASFDMFKDYKDRGEQFIKAVKSLS